MPAVAWAGLFSIKILIKFGTSSIRTSPERFTLCSASDAT